MVKNLTGVSLQPLDGKDFKIYVSRHHCFGTDAVLLANFAAAKKNDTAIDLGTGCGIIPFLFLRDGNTRLCTGVDISAEAIELCNKSAEALNLKERFIPVLSDLNDLKGKVPFGKATLVTCNPPYKAPSAGIKNPDTTLAVARHEIACTLEDVVKTAAKLLNTGGRLCICQRPERLAELMGVMRLYGIEPKRLRTVSKNEKCEPWLVLIEGKKGSNTGLRIAPPLFTEQNGTISDEMSEIYGCYKN